MPLDTAYILARRTRLKLTQEQATRAGGIDTPHPRRWWSDIESGKVANPTLTSLEGIAKALRCGVGKLVMRAASSE